MIDFSEVERSVEQLKQQAYIGKIDHQHLRTHLIDLIDVAEDGYFWMVGYQTGLWYRHDGTQWLVDNPDRLSKSLPHNSHNSSFFGGHSSPPVSVSKNHSSSAAKQNHVEWIWLFIGIIILSLVVAIIYVSI